MEDLLSSNERLCFRAPIEGPVQIIDSGKIKISIPERDGGYNHWVSSTADAPTLTIDAPDGDWELSSHITLDNTKAKGFHIGLMAGFSDGFACIFGPYSSKDIEKPEIRLEATGMPNLAAAESESLDVYLKMQKRANAYFCAYSLDEQNWISVGSYRSAFLPQSIGIIAKTFDDGPSISFTVDSLRIEHIESAEESVSINIDASSITGRIDRNIYGHFIEHLGRCIQEGIWAEMLWNRKFTGSVNEQGVIESWNAFGDGAKYSRDNSTFYTPCQSQRIDLAEGEEAGIVKQDAHLRIKPQQYTARAILKQQGLNSGVKVALRQGEQIYAEAAILNVSEEWTEYSIELEVTESDPDAQFSITATGPGTLWVGCVSLMPSDNIKGMRRDILEKIKAIKPPIIRWPGGNMASGYHWEDGIGARDRRAPRWERAWNNWEWNDFGTDEFIEFCRAVGAEPYICVNAGEAYADEAARWVEYCNGSIDTPYGRLRAVNGHPESYNVKYWGIGNEMYGEWQLGHLDGTKYALKSIEFAQAMKAAYPDIKLIGVGVERDIFNNWNSSVLPVAGGYYDYYSVHYYKGPNPEDCRELTYLYLISASHEIEKMLMETIAFVNHCADRKLPIAFDEWNIWLPDGLSQSIYALRDGLFAAGVFNVLHRLSDSVTMANLAQLVNVLGAIQTNMTDVVETPIYKAFLMYASCLDNRCEINVSSPEFDTPAGRMPLVDASATVSDDGKNLTLFIINRDTARAIPVHLDIRGFGMQNHAEISVMNGLEAYSANDFDAPERVSITQIQANIDLSKPYILPAHSVTLIKLNIDAGGNFI